MRRISIPTASSTKAKGPKASTIVATHQSRQNPDTVWVACSDGSIFHIDWTQSSEVKQVFRTNSGTAKALTVLPVELTKTAHEVVLVVESEKSHKLELVAYSKSNSTPKSIFTLKKSGSGLQLVSSTQDGRVLIGALNDRLFVGVASSNGIESLDQLSYEFFSFDCPDVVTTLDLKVDRRKQSSSTARKNRQSEFENTVDVLVGGARGGIYLYQDIVSRLQAQGEVKSEKDHFQAQKYHWHRKAVHAVKWSRDGEFEA